MTDIAVRAADASDAGAVAELLTTLGYPVSAEQARARLERARDGVGVLVAERSGEVVGVLGFSFTRHLERDEPSCRITALAVRRGERRSGVGTTLIGAVEEEAAREGCFRVEATCRPQRHEAHAFYRRIGFRERPLRFVRELR